LNIDINNRFNKRKYDFEEYEVEEMYDMEMETNQEKLELKLLKL
jgi:hypothetical protein